MQVKSLGRLWRVMGSGLGQSVCETTVRGTPRVGLAGGWPSLGYEQYYRHPARLPASPAAPMSRQLVFGRLLASAASQPASQHLVHGSVHKDRPLTSRDLRITGAFSCLAHS